MTGTGFGKLILAGEHAVVYGFPAVAFAVDLCTTVRLEAHEGPLDAPVDERGRRALAQILGNEGWRVHIDTTLPIGCGMGSSAALAVATVRALGVAEARVYELALAAERVFHGQPSGLDVAMAAHGGVMRFQNGTLEALPAPDWQVVVLDTGKTGDTRELVAGVASRRPAIDAKLEQIGALVDEVCNTLGDPERLGPLLTANHTLLTSIGVSSPECDALVALALEHGALGAKLSGAGGGGVVLALVHDPSPLRAAARSRGIRSWVCRPP